MMILEENKVCYQCDEEKLQVVTFKDYKTNGDEGSVCQDCLNNYLNGKIVFE